MRRKKRDSQFSIACFYTKFIVSLHSVLVPEIPFYYIEIFISLILIWFIIAFVCFYLTTSEIWIQVHKQQTILLEMYIEKFTANLNIRCPVEVYTYISFVISYFELFRINLLEANNNNPTVINVNALMRRQCKSSRIHCCSLVVRVLQGIYS